MALKALFLNCTLKPSPETSNTQAFIDVAVTRFQHRGVETETVRVVDYDVKPGVTSRQGDDDQWPEIHAKIMASDILVIATPVWRGDRSSVAKRVNERMDGIMSEGNDSNGQYPTYGKVGAVMVDGNEDGAKNAIAAICFDLCEHGFTLPVNAFTYYVGKAGPGPSYIEAGGDKHLFTNKMMYYMVDNAVHLAQALRDNPYPTDINALTEEAQKISGEPGPSARFPG